MLFELPPPSSPPSSPLPLPLSLPLSLPLAPAEILARSFQSILPLNAPQHIAVACSGGSDSLALLLLCQSWAEQRKEDRRKEGKQKEGSHDSGSKPLDDSVTALICDHQQRAESTRECVALKSRLEDDFGLAALIFTPRLPLSSLRGNLQQNMRLFRLQKLLDWCGKHEVSYLALGHTRDDQIETHRLQAAGLLRGRGGMREVRRARAPEQAQEQAQEQAREVFLLRPLLSASRACLRAWLTDKGVAWLEDPSNASPCYARNRMRLANARLSHTEQSRILASGATERQEEEALEEAVQRFSRVHASRHAEGYACIESKAFLALDEKVALRLLANVARSVGGKGVRKRQLIRVGRAWRACLEKFLLTNEQDDNEADDNANADRKESCVLSLGRCLLFARRRVFFATRTALNIESLPITSALSQDRLWDERLRLLAPSSSSSCSSFFWTSWTCAPLTREGVVRLRQLSRRSLPQNGQTAQTTAQTKGNKQLATLLARFEELPWRVREVMPSFWQQGMLRALPTFGITLEGQHQVRLSTRRAEELPRVKAVCACEQNLLFPTKTR